MAQLINLLLRRRVAQQQVDRVGRYQVRDHKGEQADADHHDHQEDKPARQERQHSK